MWSIKMESYEAKKYKQKIEDLETAESLLKRAKKELVNFYSDEILSVDKEGIYLNKSDYNDCLKIVRKLLLESYVD